MPYPVDFTLKPITASLTTDETCGLRLEWLRREDHEAFRRWFSQLEYGQVIPQDIDGHHFLTLRRDGQIIGALGCTMNPAGEAELHFFQVDEAERGKGYGQFLLAVYIFILKERGIKQVLCFPRPHNLLEKLYAKVGFKSTSN